MAGDFYLIIIMVILMIITILHHRADDCIHVDLQLGLHNGGYERIEAAGWPANLLFGKHTTVISVNNAKSKPCNVDPIFQLGNLEAQRVAC